MNALATFNGALPAHLANAQNPLLAAMKKGFGEGQFNRISIKGGRFHLIQNGNVVQTSQQSFIDVVIVDVQDAIGRIYFDQTYTPGTKIRPACWSNDGERPDAQAQGKPIVFLQNGTQRPVNSCAECPKNVKGSGQGGRGRACGFTRRVMVVAASDINGPAYAIELKAMSLFGDGDPANNTFSFREYAHFLGQARNGLPNGVAPNAVVTRISFDVTSDVPVLRFGVSPDNTFLSEADYQAAVARREKDDVKAMMRTAISDAYDDDVETVTTQQFSQPAAQAPVAPVTPAPVEAQTVAPPPPPPAAPVAPPPPAPVVKVLREAHPDVPQAVRDWAVAPGVTEQMVTDYLKANYPQALEPVAETPVVAPPPPPPAPSVEEKPKRTRKAKAKEVEDAPAQEPSSPALAQFEGMLDDDYDD